jgi:hypothetical protein
LGGAGKIERSTAFPPPIEFRIPHRLSRGRGRVDLDLLLQVGKGKTVLAGGALERAKQACSEFGLTAMRGDDGEAAHTASDRCG